MEEAIQTCIERIVPPNYPSGKRFLLSFNLKRKEAKKKSFPCTTSSKSFWTNISKRPASAQSHVLLCFRPPWENRQVIAPTAGAHRRRGHAQTTAQASWIARPLFASLIPCHRHRQFPRERRDSRGRSANRWPRRQSDHQTL